MAPALLPVTGEPTQRQAEDLGSEAVPLFRQIAQSLMLPRLRRRQMKWLWPGFETPNFRSSASS